MLLKCLNNAIADDWIPAYDDISARMACDILPEAGLPQTYHNNM